MGNFILFKNYMAGPIISKAARDAHPNMVQHWDMYEKWDTTGQILNNILSIITWPNAVFSIFGSVVWCAYGPLAQWLYDELEMTEDLVFWDYPWCLLNWNYMMLLAWIGNFFFW